MEGLSEVFYKDLCNRINKISIMIAGNGLGKPLNYFEASYLLLEKDVRTLSKAALSSKYNEAIIVEIAKTRDDFPDFMKSMRGRKSTKINWLIEILK